MKNIVCKDESTLHINNNDLVRVNLLLHVDEQVEQYTVDSFIFVGINFRGFPKKYQFVVTSICGSEVYSIQSNDKFPLRGIPNFVVQHHPRKPRKIDIPRKTMKPQYCLNG